MSDTESNPDPIARPDEFEESMAAVLSKPVRKRVLAILARTDDRLALSEIAGSVSDATGENCAHDSVEDAEHLTTVLLYHCDLPKLADHGLVEWDSDANRATLTTRGAACAAALGL